jgi:hypothetical protein
LIMSSTSTYKNTLEPTKIYLKPLNRSKYASLLTDETEDLPKLQNKPKQHAFEKLIIVIDIRNMLNT